nr:hypothetical protein [uncultured Draconibacterium sp.]
MDKLEKYILAETKNGFTILKDFSPWHREAIVNYEKNCVVFNLKYLTREMDSFYENFLIGVLYHEIGHLKYFKQHPITKENFTEDYKTASEYYAFEHSLLTLLEMANNGDSEPLKATFKNVYERIEKIRNNNFENENKSYSHINALLKLYESDIYYQCETFLKSISD